MLYRTQTIRFVKLPFPRPFLFVLQTYALRIPLFSKCDSCSFHLLSSTITLWFLVLLPSPLSKAFCHFHICFHSNSVKISSEFLSSSTDTNRGGFLLLSYVSKPWILSCFTQPSLSDQAVLQWSHSSPYVPAVKLVHLMAAESKRHTNQLKQCIFNAESDVTLYEFGTEEPRQMIRAALAFHMYANKKARGSKYLFTLFQEGGVLLTLAKAGRYVQAVLYSEGYRISSLFRSMPTRRVCRSSCFWVSGRW